MARKTASHPRFAARNPGATRETPLIVDAASLAEATTAENANSVTELPNHPTSPTANTESARPTHASHDTGEERFRSLTSAAPIGIFQLDLQGRCIYGNARLAEMMGPWQPRTKFVSLVHPDDREAIEEFIASTLRYSDSDGISVRVFGMRGDLRWARIRMGMLFDTQGAVRGIVGSLADVTSQVEAKAKRDQLITILERTPDFVAITDADGELSYLNLAARSLLGIEENDKTFASKHLRDLYPSWAQDAIADTVLPSVVSAGIWTGETAMVSLTGDEIPVSQMSVAYHDANGAIAFVSTIARDVTEPRELHQRLRHQALHDPLTGLPNRTLLLDRLTSALQRLPRRPGSLAVIFGDVDRFKMVNDSLGHAVGDQLLIEIAHRIRAALRPEDTIARIGGDEFVVLCEDVRSHAEAREIAQRVIFAIQDPFLIAGHEIFVTTSLGMAVTSNGDTDPLLMLRDADVAMYHAKESGKNCFQIFDEAMRARILERASFEQDLHRGLERDEFFVEYQPEIRLSDGGIASVETLVRWQHPTDGVVPPGRFIDVAEESGLIGDLGFEILRMACFDAHDLQTLRSPVTRRRITDLLHPRTQAMENDQSLRVAVNLSGRQLGMHDIVDQIHRVLEETGAKPEWLAIEITESVLMRDVDHTIRVLREIRDLDIRIGIDDFGTGYSSLAHLRAFPLDFLKIDQSFVRGLGTEADDSAIVATIINLAHNLDLAAVAEGVETDMQLRALMEFGCDLAQGFGLSRPVRAELLLAPQVP